MSNEKIVKYLKGRGPLNVDDPIERLEVLGKIGSLRNVKRENVNVALRIWSQQKKDKVINTENEQMEFATLITRQQFRDNYDSQRTPFARSITATKNHMRKRNWTFEPSSGSGVRKFDNWRGYLYADVKSKRNANKVANLLRKGGAGRVRVVPYQAKGRTYFSVYSQSANTDIVNRKSLKNAKRFGDAGTKTALSKRKFSTTWRNVNKMGIKKRRR